MPSIFTRRPGSLAAQTRKIGTIALTTSSWMLEQHGVPGTGGYLVLWNRCLLSCCAAVRDQEDIDPLLIAGLLAAYLVQNLFTLIRRAQTALSSLCWRYVAYLYDKAGSDAGTVQIKHPKPVAISNKGWAVLACSVVILGAAFYIWSRNLMNRISFDSWKIDAENLKSAAQCRPVCLWRRFWILISGEDYGTMGVMRSDRTGGLCLRHRIGGYIPSIKGLEPQTGRGFP